jgi:hypothetical protein
MLPLHLLLPIHPILLQARIPQLPRILPRSHLRLHRILTPKL